MTLRGYSSITDRDMAAQECASVHIISHHVLSFVSVVMCRQESATLDMKRIGILSSADTEMGGELSLVCYQRVQEKDQKR